MYIVLVVQSGLLCGKQVCITRDKQICVGRGSQSDFTLPRDSFISATHFLLENDEGSCWITDLNSRNGTFVNGQKVARAQLNDGDTIMAGHTVFAVQLRDEDASKADDTTKVISAERDDLERVTSDASFGTFVRRDCEDRLIEVLKSQFQPLYAVLDFSADKKLLTRIYNASQLHGLPSEAGTTAVGQFRIPLVSLPGDSPLLETLVREGWGRNWGIYLTSSGNTQELSSHLHRLLETRHAANTPEFRYCRPSVLRDYLVHCTAEDGLRCLGPIDHFLVESEVPEQMLQFSRTKSGVDIRVIWLNDPRQQRRGISNTV